MPDGYLTPAVSGSPTAAERGTKSEVAHKVGKLATSPPPYRGAPPLQSGGQNQKWPTSGQIGYLTPAVSGSPTAAERGTKSEVAHKVGKLATSPLPYRGAPPLQSGGQNQKWPTKWARWLHNLFCAFQPFLNSPQNSEYFEYRHIGWNKKNSPCRMPKTKSPAPPAPTKHLVPCDNFGVRRGGGGPPPPLWGRVLTRSAPRGRPSTAQQPGGLPLVHISFKLSAPLLASPVVGTRGTSPYFNFIHRIPTGRPTWDSRHGGHGGASPYFRNFSFLFPSSHITQVPRPGGPPLLSG